MQYKNQNWITNAFTSALIKEAGKNKKIILLDADLSDDANLKQFKYKFPNRFIQNGIAEQDMVSMAGGMALMGLLPVVNSFASFLTARANEQIYNNATENSKIIYICLYAGILPAGAGKSHQSLRDISLLSNIPKIKIFHPSNAQEAKKILIHCINKEKNTCSIRLNLGPPISENFEIKDKKFKPGVGKILAQGKKIALITYGQTMTSVAYKVNKLLKNINIKIKIINFPSLNFFNKNWLQKNLKKIDHIVFLEDHFNKGGFADLMISYLMNEKIINKISFHNQSVNDFPACGTPNEVLKYHKLDAINVFKKIKKLYENKNR